MDSKPLDVFGGSRGKRCRILGTRLEQALTHSKKCGEHTAIWGPYHVCGWWILISDTLVFVSILSDTGVGILTNAGPQYRVPYQSVSLTWSSSGLMRTMGPVITNVTGYFLC